MPKIRPSPTLTSRDPSEHHEWETMISRRQKMWCIRAEDVARASSAAYSENVRYRESRATLLSRLLQPVLQRVLRSVVECRAPQGSLRNIARSRHRVANS